LDNEKDFIIDLHFQPKPVSEIWKKTSSDISQSLTTPFDDSKNYEKLPLKLKRNHRIIIPQKLVKEKKPKEIIDEFVDETIRKNPGSENYQLTLTEKKTKVEREEIYKRAQHKVILPAELESKKDVLDRFLESELENVESNALLTLETKRTSGWSQLEVILKASVPFEPSRDYETNPLLFKKIHRFLVPAKHSSNDSLQQRLPPYIDELIKDFFKGEPKDVSVRVSPAPPGFPQVSLEEFVLFNENSWKRVSQMIVGELEPVQSARHQKKPQQ